MVERLILRSPTDSETAVADQNELLTLAKNFAGASTYATVGDVVNFTYDLTNDGNVVLTPAFSVNDDKIAAVTCPADASGVGNNDANLDPGETVQCTGSYTVTQQDLDDGSITNIATGAAQGPGGAVASLPDSETATAVQNPVLEIVKQIVAGDPFATVGDSIDYTYDLTNTGNVSLSPPFNVSDDRITGVVCPADASAVGNNDADLNPGETIQCTGTYTVTQIDLDAGSVTNIASAAANDPNGLPVSSPTDTQNRHG